jgi:hypothetical protein
MNIAPKAQRKNFCLDMVKILPKGPLTASFSSVWNALFKAMVERDEGQTAAAG